jgi:two-component system, NarL family, sensor kinase
MVNSRYVSFGLAVVLCCLHVALMAQSVTNEATFEAQKQQAIAALQHYPRPDTARIHALLRVLNIPTFLKERKELLPYQQQAIALSRRLHYTYGIAQCYVYAGAYYKSASDYAAALRHYDSALYLISNARDSQQLALKAIVFERKGMIYQLQENYYPALNCFFEALKYLAGRNNYRTVRLYIFITEIYLGLQNVKKASEFLNRNLRIVQSDLAVKELAASVYLTAVNIALEKNDLQTASTYVDSITPFANDPQQTLIRFGYYMKKGHIHFRQQQYNQALNNYRLAYQTAGAMGHHSTSVSISLHYLSATALKLGNYAAAKSYAEEDLELATAARSKAATIEALTNLAGYYQATGHASEAVRLLSRAIQLKDSVAAETNLNQVNVLGAAYEKEMQENEIARLQHAKMMQDSKVDQQTLLNRFFIAFIIILLAIGYLGYRNFTTGAQLAESQQEIQRQKIIELEKNRQLLSIDAMMKGQEEERSRIAKDLHDGLGGLLSGTKLSFMNIKEKIGLSPEHTLLFDHSLTMLDNTIVDLRKVAQNLMPATLVKYGLYDALQDFCDSIRAASGIKMSYQQYGIQRNLDSTAAVFVYRIIQELVSNAIKHAEAGSIIVQLSIGEHTTRITVEDDGKGFDKTMLNGNRGAGMTNIHYRVQYLNGQYDIITSPGNGTSINITLTA